MKLYFNEESHKYTLETETGLLITLPSVTQIFSDLGFYKTHFKSDYYMELSNAFHEVIHLYEQGNLDYESLDDAIVPYFESYLKSKMELNFKIIESEKPLYHKKLLFAGTMDAIIEKENAIWLIDFKMGLGSNLTEMQTSAYLQMCDNKDEILYIASLNFSKGKPAKLVKYDEQRGWLNFKKCLDVYNLKQRL